MVLFNRFSLIVSLALFLFAACKPVNSLTKIMKMPDEYTRNYCCGEVSVPKSAEKGIPWIVYSDRNQNPTFYIPGGKVKQDELSYFEPLAVINEEGDHVEVVRYKKENFEGRRVKDPTKAEYLGWIPKSNLILSSKAMTDVATGFVMKLITMVHDTLPLKQTDSFFHNGEVVLYGEPELLNPIGTIPFQKPIFLSKRSEDKSKCLVIGVENFTPEKSSSIKSGWVSSSMLQPLGEMLYGDFSKMPIKRMSFRNTNQENKMAVSKSSMENYLLPNKLPDFVGVNPIYGIEEYPDNTVVIKTSVPVSIVNDENNMVYSLAGTPITKHHYNRLMDKLMHINIMVVFSGQKEVESKFNQYVSYLQQFDGIIKKHSQDFQFRLGYNVGFDAENCEFSKSKPCENISSVLLNLQKYADNTQRRMKFTNDAWAALRESVDLLSEHKDEQNIVIVIGENGNQKELIDETLVNKIVDTNCRIIGCQLFSNNGNSFNNFVLQVEDMIYRSAEKLAKEKKKQLVHSSQLCSNNRYKEFSENVYGLDYPNNSMQQGWVIFPKKKETLSPDLLLSVADSTIGMIKHETNNVLTHLCASFKKTGVGRLSINSDWLKRSGFPSSFQGMSNSFQTLSSMNPVSNFPTSIRVDTNNLPKGQYLFFLTDSELNRIRQYLRELLILRVDSKNITSSQKKLKLRSCPDLIDDRIVVPLVENRKYQNTSKIRKSMFKTFIRWAQDDKVYPLRKKRLKQMTISRIQQETFSKISFNPFMVSTKLSLLKRKSYVSDYQLDEFQDYLLSKQKTLEDAINNNNKYEFNGQTYYAISADLLP